MNPEDQNQLIFLTELARQTENKTESQISMFTIGSTLGLSKSETSAVAEGLMVENLVELRTLAGSISISIEGLKKLGFSSIPAESIYHHNNFSSGPICNEEDRSLTENTLTGIKTVLSQHKLQYQLLEEFLLDIKTIEVQLLSPRAKIAIIKEVLKSLLQTFEKVPDMQPPQLLISLC